MAKPKNRPRYGPTARRNRGTPVAACGFLPQCRLREFLSDLDDEELRLALEGVEPGALRPVFSHMGVHHKIETHRGRQFFKARLHKIPQEVQHYLLQVFAEAPIADVARQIGVWHVNEDGVEEYDEDIDVYAVMRGAGLAMLVERWPRGIVRLVLECLWDDGSLTTEQRNEFLAEADVMASNATAVPVAVRSPPTPDALVVETSAGAPPTVPAASPNSNRDVDDGYDEQNERGSKTPKEILQVDAGCGDERARRRALTEVASPKDASGHPFGPPAGRAANSAPLPDNFPPLEQLLARALDAAEATTATGPELSGLTAALECLVRLDPARADLWHLYGRAMAMWPDEPGATASPALDSALPATRLEFLSGQLRTMAVRGEQDRAAALVLSHRDEAEQLLRRPPATPAATTAAIDPVPAVVLAAHLDEPRRVARLLQLVSGPFAEWHWFMQQARVRATSLIGAGAAVEAEILLRAVEAALWRWAALPERPGTGLEREATEITLLRAVCRCHRRDFAGAAQLLQGIDRDLLDAAGRVTASREAGLAIAEVSGLAAVRFPRRRPERAQMRERLGRARAHLEAAVEGDDAGGDGPHLIATVLLGALATCEDDDAAAARHLGRAAPILAEQPDNEELARAVAFHAALARLRLLEPGTDDAAFRDMSAAMAAGYLPPDEDLLSAAVALEAHASPHAGAFLAKVASLAPNAAGLVDLLIEHARNSDPAAATAAETRAGDARLSLATRYALLDSVLTAASRRNDVAVAARVADEIDEVLIRAGQIALDERWAHTLGTDETLRLALEPVHADATRLEVLRRMGRLDEARAIAKSLFYRAANGSLRGFDATDLAELLAELGTADDELADVRRLVHEPEGQVPAAAEQLTSPLRVIFVGGSPVQEQYVPHLEASIAMRYRGMVAVDWFMTGWGSNWSQAAERIEAAYERASAVVLMTFVRTNLGRWTRRTAGEHGLPWLSCTGHGRASLERAIDRAVAVAVEQEATRSAQPDRPGMRGGSIS